MQCEVLQPEFPFVYFSQFVKYILVQNRSSFIVFHWVIIHAPMHTFWTNITHNALHYTKTIGLQWLSDVLSAHIGHTYVCTSSVQYAKQYSAYISVV